MLSYAQWLIGLSIFFVIAERVFPWRREQKPWREGIVTDLFYLVLNGHWLGALLSTPYAYGWVKDRFDSVLGAVPIGSETTLVDFFYLDTIAGWSLWAQFALLFFARDLIEWCIHNLLHRVPWFWQFHKVHHSIHDLDWVGVMRFHWFEKIFYDGLKYLVLVPLGFDPRVLFIYAVFATFWGFYNHANLRIGLGPLRFLFNSPQMHVWHHAKNDTAPHLCNFGINLSLWDWIFGTAYWPKDRTQPNAVGFDGDESFPRNIVEQEVWPLRIRDRGSGIRDQGSEAGSRGDG